MNYIKWLALGVVVAGLGLQAEARRGPGGPMEAGFDIIVESVDSGTALELTERRATIASLRDELMALRDADDIDDATIDALRSELRDARHAQRSQVRDIVESNDQLRADLREAGELAREQHRAERAAARDAFYDELVAVATGDQAAALASHRADMQVLRDEMRAARGSGATRDELAAFRDEARTLRQEQRALVTEIVDANRDALGDVLEDARVAREELRGRGFHRRGPGFGRDPRDG